MKDAQSLLLGVRCLNQQPGHRRKLAKNAVSPVPPQDLHFDKILVTGKHLKAGKGCVEQSYSKLQSTNSSLRSWTRGLSRNVNACRFLYRDLLPNTAS